MDYCIEVRQLKGEFKEGDSGLQKISYILLIIILSAGCSVNRIGRTKSYDMLTDNQSTGIYDGLLNQNITKENFYIQKAEIEVISQEGSEKLLGTVKFKSPDNYSISIKSRTGIEAVRIFISSDTILINDRINKKLFCGSPDYLKSKYGITASVLPILFGDYVDSSLQEDVNIQCAGGIFERICNIEGIKISYIIDCGKRKSVIAKGKSSTGAQGIEIQYSEFKKVGTKLIPENIEINDAKKDTTIKIKIVKIEAPWDGLVEFIPGIRYEIVELR
jgi:hypothetical protein